MAMKSLKWSRVTSAAKVKPGELRRAAKAAGALLVGVAGFSGAWSNNARVDAEGAARKVFRSLFEEARGERVVWCVSGATNTGVPRVAYEVAEELDIHRVGITAAAAYSFPIASLHHLVVVGRRFGDESRIFVDLCERFWLVGGGTQSEKEIRMAHAMGKHICVVRGLGGAADSLDLRGVRHLSA